MNDSGGFIRNNLNQFAFIYRLVDIFVIQICLISIAYIYLGRFDVKYFVLGLLSNMAYLFFAELFVLYRSWRSGSFKEMLFYTVCSWSLSLFPLFIIIFFTKQNELFSRIILGLWIILVMLLLCAWRALFRKLLVSARRKGYNTRAVGIVGLTKRGIDLANEIIQFPESGFKLIAVFDERSPDRLSVQHKELLAGGIAEGVKMAQEGKIEILYIALPLTDKARIDNILKALGDTTVDVHIVPDIFTFNLLHSRMGHVGKIQTISVYDSPMRGGYSIMKRMEDVFLSLTILSLIAIPMLLIAIAIKLTSKGPVLFKQDRYGIVGKKIKVWKFRTMRVMDNGEVVKQATKNDPRITPIGAFLRRTSLDELPQFFNVLQGTMSVVGPRPHAVSHNEEYRKKVAYYMLRHKMKPGITGWAQVNGWRGETDTVDKMEMRIKYDLDYIRNWSIWMDFKIVVFTLFRGFVGKNVY
ncbi:undecaprenyl-phosphate glucose phosphotransferase [Aestuariibacter sp. A3R04]|uniref:undecaprenyl-phosphate glucose phosphotransferase n=1 Tax=Aestuariibacter sp. A3R04 TaxID=2841571 RepID=UPI001C07F1C2|nr:undecaprenyl-phosphate glucose phosphotransferase [Aestuariibacter sp. A3R04]MBU3023758.1 undecaprenyl-phosphate glucose phosphotransferase [Aestuariibacter sp. A3R04]